jgi:hypothetical protein
MSEVNATPAKGPREKKADYFFIDASGSQVDDIESATGIEYVPLAGGGLKYQIPGVEAGKIATMLAVAGAKIELRNAGRGAAEIGDSGKAAQRMARLVDGDWGDLSGTGGGRAPVDEDKLFEAMATVLTNLGKPYTESKIRAGFKDGGTIAGKAQPDGKSYKSACMTIPGVEEEYKRLTGKVAVAVESIADDDFS